MANLARETLSRIINRAIADGEPVFVCQSPDVKEQARIDAAIRADPALRGKQAYDASVQARPLYGDGTPRKAWSQLGDFERNSWEREPRA